MRKRFAAAMGMLLIVAAALTVPAGTALAGSPGVATTIGSSGTTSPRTGGFTPSGSGDVTDEEFPGEEDGADATGGGDGFTGTIVDRSLSHGNGHGVSVNSGKKAKSEPAFENGFEGLNLFQQRYARGGNQFTVEPPDQGLCVGNGFVVEAVNDVLNVYDGAGHSLLPDNTATNIVSGFPTDVDHAVDLNSFFGYAPAINRTTGVRAQFVTDPSCLYDAATQRFFVAVLTLETLPNGAFTGANHIDIAVSQTSNPTGSWTIYRLPVQDDGTQGTPDHGCARNNDGTGHGPCLGDYPHIGADANGVLRDDQRVRVLPELRVHGRADLCLLEGCLGVGCRERRGRAVRHGARWHRRQAGLHRLARPVVAQPVRQRATAAPSTS